MPGSTELMWGTWALQCMWTCCILTSGIHNSHRGHKCWHTPPFCTCFYGYYCGLRYFSVNLHLFFWALREEYTLQKINKVGHVTGLVNMMCVKVSVYEFRAEALGSTFLPVLWRVANPCSEKGTYQASHCSEKKRYKKVWPESVVWSWAHACSAHVNWKPSKPHMGNWEKLSKINACLQMPIQLGCL